MFHTRIYGFWLMHQFRCYLLDISPEIMRHDVVLRGSNYLLNRLQLFSQEVASLSPKEMTKHREVSVQGLGGNLESNTS